MNDIGVIETLENRDFVENGLFVAFDQLLVDYPAL